MLRRPPFGFSNACCGRVGFITAPAAAATAAAAAATAIAQITCPRRSFHTGSGSSSQQKPTSNSPKPVDKKAFVAYEEIDLPTPARLDAIRKLGITTSRDEWVAVEKVHGTNLSLYLFDERTVRFGKRTGLMNPEEDFFGYHCLIPDLTRYVTTVHRLLKQKFGLPVINKVVLNGEMFGNRYDHPKVRRSKPVEYHVPAPFGRPPFKKSLLDVDPIQEEAFPQYAPDLHFFAFDIKYSVSYDPNATSEEALKLDPILYDDFCDICRQVDGLLYAKALVRGTLDQCMSFDVEHFRTTIPTLLGLGNYPLDKNTAEGVIVRHTQRGSPRLRNVPSGNTIIKYRCSAFMEQKHAQMGFDVRQDYEIIRTDAIARAGGVAQANAEAVMSAHAANANGLIINGVAKSRVTTLLTKVGRQPLLSGEISKQEFVTRLALDALKDFCKNVDPVNFLEDCTVSELQEIFTNVYTVAVKLVDEEWEGLVTSKQREAAETEEDHSQHATAGDSAVDFSS